MLSWLEVAVGVLAWCGVLWDGFATVILPSTVAPMSRFSGRYYKLTWRIWGAAGRRIRSPRLRLSFLAVYGPNSIVLLLVLWAGLIVVAFAVIYHGLGPRFQSPTGPVRFGTLLYTSASTFLTLGLGDVTCSDPIGRLFIILEAGSGYVFLALMITYMPVLHQAYGAREVDSLLIHSRAGHPPSALKLLRRCSGTEHSEILGALREAERWMAEVLQSHLSHPVLSFYRGQHRGQSWLVAITTVLDTCAILIAGGAGPPVDQARITYRMGVRLLKDLMDALDLKLDRRCCVRLSTAELPALLAALKASDVPLTVAPGAATELLRLVRRYDVYLLALSHCFVIPLPSLSQPGHPAREKGAPEEPSSRTDPPVSATIPQGKLADAASEPVDKPPGGTDS